MDGPIAVAVARGESSHGDDHTGAPCRRLAGGIGVRDRHADASRLGIEMRRSWLVAEAVNPRLVIIDTLAKVKPDKAGTTTDYAANYAVVGELQKLATEFRVCILLVTYGRPPLMLGGLVT